MSDAFKWLMENGGIMDRKAYPYKVKKLKHELCLFIYLLIII